MTDDDTTASTPAPAPAPAPAQPNGNHQSRTDANGGSCGDSIGAMDPGADGDDDVQVQPGTAVEVQRPQPAQTTTTTTTTGSGGRRAIITNAHVFERGHDHGSISGDEVSEDEGPPVQVIEPDEGMFWVGDEEGVYVCVCVEGL